MEATVKHRIVGSLMLLSLAVIILPFFLDGAGIESYQATQKQPQVPANVFESTDGALATGVDLTLDPSDTQVIELSPIALTKDSSPAAANVVKPTAAQTDQVKTATPAVKPASKVVKAKATQDDSLLNPQGLPNGWAVQLGSFGNQSNAVRLKDKLIKAGFAAYIIPKDTLFKVLVGPELSRAKAEALKKQLDAKFQMNSLVILYEVIKP